MGGAAATAGKGGGRGRGRWINERNRSLANVRGEAEKYCLQLGLAAAAAAGAVGFLATIVTSQSLRDDGKLDGVL